jgi:DNA-directed RNA polymerase specialized sigma24 family protein
LSSDGSNSDDPAEGASGKKNLDDPDEGDSGKKKSSLTKEAYDKLLHALSPDRDKAAEALLQIQLKLARYFEWRRVDAPEELADETVNRVARRISEGQQIDNLPGYFYGVAKLVFFEWEKTRKPTYLDDLPPIEQPIEPEICDPDPRFECFDNCVEKLESENRTLIMDYYQEERRAKIELRQQLADKLRIPLNALRIRVHRIRKRLEECINKCLGSKPAK